MEGGGDSGDRGVVDNDRSGGGGMVLFVVVMVVW